MPSSPLALFLLCLLFVAPEPDAGAASLLVIRLCRSTLKLPDRFIEKSVADSANHFRLLTELLLPFQQGGVDTILVFNISAPDDLVLTTKGATQALAEAWDLITVLQEADADQTEQLSRLPPEDRTDWVHFDHYEQAVNHRHGLLEQTILSLEPQSIDDVLSLLLVTQDAFDHFASNHSDHQENVRTAGEWDAIERAMHAMIRWLVHNGGAASPLLEKNSVPAQLVPLPEQMATVLGRARELSQRDEDTSDARTRERPGNHTSSSG